MIVFLFVLELPFVVVLQYSLCKTFLSLSHLLRLWSDGRLEWKAVGGAFGARMHSGEEI